ncbi:hypothetical protein BDZ88DRAFT_196344 [Geranomyces variabilis]|nr:hypothetical protein BDZ88DRAFT_196344 [Geranomyces variabilis]KAJ3140242.1 hypothetical protein HDU90_008469 [Geranomyces variabilis]
MGHHWKTHQQHDGERFVQQRRHAPSDISRILERIISDDMPAYHASFFEGLKYVAIAALDADGRPWATLLAAPQISVSPPGLLDVRASLPPHDPFARCVLAGGASSQHPQRFALLGVDFTNRRRNKAAGVITAVSGDASNLRLTLQANENLGNCPKYITVRSLETRQRTPKPILDGTTADLSPQCLAVIAQASTIWLATCHDDAKHSERSDVGLNHRGGPPGFVRAYRDDTDGAWYLVLPDYSGNRFYQSLGNVQTDRRAGLLFVDFHTGNVCQVTGDAENIYDEEAAAIMPRVSLLTRIKVTSVVLIDGGVNLSQTSPDKMSPYNPPLRLLTCEGTTDAAVTASASATLVAVRRRTRNVAEFTFELDGLVPDNTRPGAYIVLAFANILGLPAYSHMNDGDPQSLNDDLVRTWTLSSLGPGNRVSITVKLVPSGAVSPFLHALARQTPLPRLTLPCLGVACDFSCIDSAGRVPPRMLWVAGGVGLTPFLAFQQGITARNLKSDVVLLYACRDDEAAMLEDFMQIDPKSIIVFSMTAPARGQHVQRRMQAADVTAFADRPAYLCGPAQLTTFVTKWLEDANCPAVHQEKFTF